MEKRIIKIPPGYTPADKWGGAHFPTDCIRYFRGNIIYTLEGAIVSNPDYVFNPKSLEYNQFLEKCRGDKKALERALRKEFKIRNLPIWTPFRSRPKYAKGYRRMGFLIDPPLASSDADETTRKTDRMQSDDFRDDFVLHFDEDHALQCVRFWQSATKQDLTQMRLLIANEIERRRVVFSEYYGDWSFIAKEIADILEKVGIRDYIDKLADQSR